jgi:hypothetical protein
MWLREKRMCRGNSCQFRSQRKGELHLLRRILAWQVRHGFFLLDGVAKGRYGSAEAGGRSIASGC